jgi:hypothetical protein
MVLILLSVEEFIFVCLRSATALPFDFPQSTKCNLYLDSSLETVIREPISYRLHMFHVQNFMSIFLCLYRLSKESVHVRGSLIRFVTCLLYKVRGCKPHTQPPSWRTTPFHLSAAANSIYSKLTSVAGGRPFHPQREDAVCCGDKGTQPYWPITW